LKVEIKKLMTPYWYLFTDFRHHRSLCARYRLLNQPLMISLKTPRMCRSTGY